MKISLATILTIAMIVIAVCIAKTHKETHRLAVVVRRLLCAGLVVVLVNIVSLLTRRQWVCSLAYSIYFVAADWLLFYLLQFSLEFIGTKFEDYVKKKLMILLLLVDSASVIANVYFGHLFYLNPVMVYNEHFYSLSVNPLFYTHYAIILMLVAFCLISLFYGSAKAPVFYRRKFFIVALILVAIITLNLCTFRSAIDVSVIGYVVEAVCIYYCAFVYTPQRLLPKTLFEVAHGMTYGLCVLDIEGKRLYCNRAAEEMLTQENPLTDKHGMSLQKWCEEQYRNYTADFVKERTYYKKDGTEVILKIELRSLKDVNSQLQGGYFVIVDRTDEVNEFKKQRYMSTHDSLTGMYNMSYFCEQVEKYIMEYPNEQLLMICTDIKDFKMINDFLGTASGDIVLMNFARALRERIGGAIMHTRISNDVFGILISKTDYKEEQFIIEDEGLYFLGIEKDISFPVINYVGVYEITERNIPVSIMCDRARMAITTIKGNYHNKVAYYDRVLRDDIMREQELINDFKDAIEQKQFKMYLQPQVSSGRKLLGAEALIRWKHPQKGFIMPGEFIPVFESNGLISDVDRYIWEAACMQLRKWKEEGRQELYISVNISPKDFYFLDIHGIFTKLVEKYEIDAKNLKLEITETAIVMDFERQVELIKRLRQSGFVVEIDDFGSGYSSLNMLKDLHVDVLKIDMGFLQKAEDEERGRKILQMIISLSKQLDMPVITEGVETEEQVQILTEMGCDIFQGYYFSKPIDTEQFEELFLKDSGTIKRQMSQ